MSNNSKKSPYLPVIMRELCLTFKDFQDKKITFVVNWVRIYKNA